MPLIRWKRALAVGFLSWLLPFAFSVAIFPLKKVSAPLFETAMSVCLVAVAAPLAARYCRGTAAPRFAEALAVGFLWVGVNLVFDYPLFAYGPMKITAARYYSEIGAGYALYPAFLAGAAWLAGRRPATT